MSISDKIESLVTSRNAIRTKMKAVGQAGSNDKLATLASNLNILDTSDANATENDILTGKTAYVNGSKITGIATAGIDTSDATATASDILSGKTAYAKGSKLTGTATAGTDTSDATLSSNANLLSGNTAYAKGVKYTGSMTDQGTKTASLNCGESYTIPAGKHSGSGKVTANSLSSQTGVDSGKTAITAASVRSGYQGWVKGNKVSGTMSSYTDSSQYINAGGSYYINQGYHSGGYVYGNSLSSQTSGTATAEDIADGKTAWVNGIQITGTAAGTSNVITDTISWPGAGKTITIHVPSMPFVVLVIHNDNIPGTTYSNAAFWHRLGGTPNKTIFQSATGAYMDTYPYTNSPYGRSGIGVKSVSSSSVVLLSSNANSSHTSGTFTYYIIC